MKNNFVQLIGFLGEDAKAITKENKSYTILNLATTESYPIKKEGKTEWQKREAIWHDVFVFHPKVSTLAKTLKQGNKITVTGEIAYKSFKDEKGYTRKQAYIIADWIESIVYERKEQPPISAITQEFVEDLVERFAT